MLEETVHSSMMQYVRLENSRLVLSLFSFSYFSISIFFILAQLRRVIGQSLFSLILSSCIVAPNREIVNKYPFIFSSAMSNQVEIKNISKDINMDKLRGRSSIQSKAISRVMLAFSTTFLQPYVNRIEAQNNNPDWA